MTLLCNPARIYFLPNFFEGWELLLLDREEDEAIEEWVNAKEESMLGVTHQANNMDIMDDVSDDAEMMYNHVTSTNRLFILF
jgi:hypothetical protein